MRSLSLTLILALSSLADAGDWPRFLGPTRNGVSTETGLIKTFPKNGPTVLWQHPVGDGYSSPVVAGKDLVIFYRQNEKNVVECLDAATGKHRWKFDYATNYSDRFGKGDGPRATPIISEKHVYTLGAKGQLHCLDRANGKKVWAKDLLKEYKIPPNFFGVGTTPLLDGQRLFVNVGGGDAGIVAFDAATGKELWKATSDEASYSSPVLATLAGKKRLVFFTRTGLVILDPDDGKVLHQKRWRSRNPASVNASVPVVVGDEIFLSACYETGAVVLRVGKDKLTDLWSNDEALSCHFSSCVYHDGLLFGFHGRQEQGAEFRCIDWKTGKVNWSKEGFGCGSLVLADGELIVMTEGGDLVLVDPAKAYREKARASVLKGTVRAHLALSEGRFYCRDGTRLVCWQFK
jgi:outer membrane protein assembly factor BamB